MRNNNLPLITIIVPIYNGADYIRECILSIMNQDYTKLEIILVDDGSSDNSLQILREYEGKDSRIRVVAKENGGVSSARNAAMNIMSGKYLCLVDQDDCIAPDYVSYFLQLILHHCAEIAVVPQARRFVGEFHIEASRETDYVKVLNGQEAARQMLYYNFIIAPWNKMISTELIYKNNILFVEKLWGGEGFLFSIECFQRAEKVAVGHKRVYYYRCDNSNSGMTKFNEWILHSSLEAQSMIKNGMVDKSKRMMAACEYAMWHTNCDMFSYLVGCNAAQAHYDTYKAVRKVCRRKAIYAFGGPISLKEKLKAVTYMISPELAVAVINKFRLRKYTRG